jgi:hypothetical protein
MKKYYGKEPQVFNTPIEIKDNQSKYFLYMPIKMPYSYIKIPSILKDYEPLVLKAIKNEEANHQSILDLYVYLSVEVSPVKAGMTQKRPGWHTDGFLTDDINYIWHNDLPTEFCIQEFTIALDHNVSMEQFTKHARNDFIKTYPVNKLMRLTDENVHRCALATKHIQSRIFVKVSFSKEKYNLKGNTHNPLFDYEWVMHDRQEVRNCPIKKESDYII